MSSIKIKTLRQEFPDISDAEAAALIASKYRHVAILKYKSDPIKDYDHLGLCDTDSEVEGYLNSPYCHNVEIIYDRRPTTILITQEIVVGKKCERCNKHTSPESLSLTGNDDYFICGECESMFCTECYMRLQLSDGDTGYGKCSKCKVLLTRAIPGTYAIPGGNSLQITEPSESDIADFITQTLSDTTFAKIDPESKINSELEGPKGSLEKQLIKSSGKSSESWDGNIDEVNRLIAEGADINSTAGSDKTPLMEASIEGHSDIANVLLDHGADVNIEDWDGRTALMFAAQNGHKDIVIALLDKGAELEKKDNRGETALIKASNWGREEISTIIILYKGDEYNKCGICLSEFPQETIDCPNCGSGVFETAKKQKSSATTNLPPTETPVAVPKIHQQKRWWQFWKKERVQEGNTETDQKQDDNKLIIYDGTFDMNMYPDSETRESIAMSLHANFRALWGHLFTLGNEPEISLYDGGGILAKYMITTANMSEAQQALQDLANLWDPYTTG